MSTTTEENVTPAQLAESVMHLSDLLIAAERERQIEEKVNKLRDALIRGEPVFVLYGRDPIAQSCVLHWAGKAYTANVNPNKIRDAVMISNAMEAWPVALKKIPD